jgi:hypothetical protein
MTLPFSMSNPIKIKESKALLSLGIDSLVERLETTAPTPLSAPEKIRIQLMNDQLTFAQ